MTHRVHHYGFRLGYLRPWKSRWFDPKAYPAYLREDTLLREWLSKRLEGLHVSAIEIERSPSTLHVIVKTSRPGILIGRGGEGIEKLKRDIAARLRKINRGAPASRTAERHETSSVAPTAGRARPSAGRELKLTIEEVRSPETDAAIVAEQIREDVMKRVRFRRILKQAVDKVMAHREVKGVKVMLSGRLDGAEMSRTEWAQKGSIPLQTLRADVDYALAEAHTTYGTIGIKVWIYKGDIFEKSEKS